MKIDFVAFPKIKKETQELKFIDRLGYNDL